MAKFGEGDPRWLVEKREDGTNVKSWHWQERDVLAWSKRRLRELFDGAVLVESPRVVATGLESLTGEAFLNNRKAKLMATYELRVVLGWRADGSDGSPAVTGTLELPYLADENADEDPEVKVATADESPAAAALRTALLRQGGRKAVCKLVAKYLAELRAGAPLKGEGAAAGDAAEASAAASAAAAAGGNAGKAAAASGAGAANGAAANGAAKPAAANKAAASSSRTTLTLTREGFRCRPADLFECFTVEGRVCAFTRSAAQVDARPGGAFAWFNGGVTGRFLELAAPRALVMEWRFSSWPDGCASRVELKFEEPVEPGSTTATLTQTGIPEEDRYGNPDVKATVEAGWDEQIFTRIRQVFGFGA